MIITLHLYESKEPVPVAIEQIELMKPHMHGTMIVTHNGMAYLFQETERTILTFIALKHAKFSPCMADDNIIGSVSEVQEKLRKMRGNNNMENILKISLDEGAIQPERAHPEDAGMDLFTPKEVFVPARGSAIINTGVHVQIPVGYAGIIEPKSGLNVKHDIIAHGVIDAGYTGAIVVKLYNLGYTGYLIHKGEKITQMIIHRVFAPEMQAVEAVSGGSRGNGGFGSTGK